MWLMDRAEGSRSLIYKGKPGSSGNKRLALWLLETHSSHKPHIQAWLDRDFSCVKWVKMERRFILSFPKSKSVLVTAILKSSLLVKSELPEDLRRKNHKSKIIPAWIRDKLVVDCGWVWCKDAERSTVSWTPQFYSCHFCFLFVSLSALKLKLNRYPLESPTSRRMLNHEQDEKELSSVFQ